MTDVSSAELARAVERLNATVDRLSDKVESLPDSMDRNYVRKDVQAAQIDRLEADMEALGTRLDRLANNIRWAIAAILIPLVVSVVALISAHTGGQL